MFALLRPTLAYPSTYLVGTVAYGCKYIIYMMDSDHFEPSRPLLVSPRRCWIRHPGIRLTHDLSPSARRLLLARHILRHRVPSILPTPDKFHGLVKPELRNFFNLVVCLRERQPLGHRRGALRVSVQRRCKPWLASSTSASQVSASRPQLAMVHPLTDCRRLGSPTG